MKDFLLDYTVTDIIGYLGHNGNRQKQICELAGIKQLYGRKQTPSGLSIRQWGYSKDLLKSYLKTCGYIEVRTDEGTKLAKKQNLKDKLK